jgi:hypothetical protein
VRLAVEKAGQVVIVLAEMLMMQLVEKRGRAQGGEAPLHGGGEVLGGGISQETPLHLRRSPGCAEAAGGTDPHRMNQEPCASPNLEAQGSKPSAYSPAWRLRELPEETGVAN